MWKHLNPFISALLVFGFLGCQPVSRQSDICQDHSQCSEGKVCISQRCIQPQCQVDADCVGGMNCANYQCIEPNGCASDADCVAPTPRCNSSQRCVECLEFADCDGGAICRDELCVVPQCVTDDQCELNHICIEGICMEGCKSYRDCPASQHCLTNEGPHGTCAECELPDDCGAGRTCENYRCVSYCTLEEHCSPRHCNTGSHQCVDCLKDEHCGAGLICQGELCVAGCRENPDCSTGHCDVGRLLCVQCLSNDHCPRGTICSQEGTCINGCQSGRDCPDTLKCNPTMGEHGTCVQCLEKADCQPDQVCQDGLCVFFCQNDQDCSQPLPACNTQNGTCVVCSSSKPCVLGTICVDFNCLPGCRLDQDCVNGKVCDTSLGAHGGCVQCKDDQNCLQGYHCDSNTCVLSGSEMVRIPASVFVMGSDSSEGDSDEHPSREVALPTYYIDRTEVTNAQYQACVQSGACIEPKDVSAFSDPQKQSHPVVFVTWDQAHAFCAWMGKSLPTEARWERAARGATLDRPTYPWGFEPADCARENFSGCIGGTVAVASYANGVSSEGVMDLAGNVWEWVVDFYSDTYYAEGVTDDPYGPLTGDYRVIRGGAYDSVVAATRSANRSSNAPDQANASTGFRCALRGVPTASFGVTPLSGPFQTTTFSVDASQSSDPNQPQDSLEVRWDWQDDGVYDSPWSTSKTANYRYFSNGIYRIRLEVRDPDGNLDSTTKKIVAEGDQAWDGAPCETTQDCATGFECVVEELVYHTCREDCSIGDTTCVLEGRSCQIWYDILGAHAGLACLAT